MGIFNKLIDKAAKSNFGQKVFQPGGTFDKVTKPIQYVGAFVSNPVYTVKHGLKASVEKAGDEGFEKGAGKVLLNTGTVAAAVLTGGTTVGRTAAATVGKSLVSKGGQFSITKTAAVGTTAFVGANILSKTDKPVKAAAKAPGALANFGQNIGEFIDEPSRLKAEQILKENPAISGLTLGAAGLVVGKSLLPAANLATNLNTNQKIKDLENQNILPITRIEEPAEYTTKQKPIAPETAVTPATQIVKPSAKPRTSYKRRSKARKPSISQRVNIRINNKSSSNTKRYINNRVSI